VLVTPTAGARGGDVVAGFGCSMES